MSDLSLSRLRLRALYLKFKKEKNEVFQKATFSTNYLSFTSKNGGGLFFLWACVDFRKRKGGARMYMPWGNNNAGMQATQAPVGMDPPRISTKGIT